MTNDIKQEFCDDCRDILVRPGVFTIKYGREGMFEHKNGFKLCPSCFADIAEIVRKKVIGK